MFALLLVPLLLLAVQTSCGLSTTSMPYLATTTEHLPLAREAMDYFDVLMHGAPFILLLRLLILKARPKKQA
mgnify:CR=1 FL=1